MRISGVVLLCLMSLVGGGCSPDSLPGVSLLVEQPALTMQPGTEAEVPVSIVRKGGFEGPVQVELKGLPSGVESVQVRIPSGESSAVLRLSTYDPVSTGTHPVDVVATAPGMSDTDRFSLEVTDVPPELKLPTVAFEPATPTVMKGGSHEVSLVVNRTGRSRVGFWVEPEASRPWIFFEPVFVPYDATRATLHVTVDEHQLVGLRQLPLWLRVGSRTEYSSQQVEVTGPEEEAPQLTAADPRDALVGVGAKVTLTGTGLSSTTSLVLRATWGSRTETSTAGITPISATRTEVKAEVQWPWGWEWNAPPSAIVLEVTTPTGTATVPFTFFPLYVDPVEGSDETGRGTPSSPFSSIPRAVDACLGCYLNPTNYRLQCVACPIFLAPGLHRPGNLEVINPALVVGTGELHGDNPTVLEGAGEERFIVRGATLKNVKVTGYAQGVEALWLYRYDKTNFPPLLEDVWVIKP